MNEDNQDAQFRTWLNMQKNIFYDFQLQAENSVTQNRVIKLVLDVGILDNNDDDIIWNKRLKQLVIYCREHGKCPNEKEDYTLYNWIRNQRRRLFLGEIQINRAARKKKLAMFGFDMTKIVSESFIGDSSNEVSKSTEEQADENVERRKIRIPKREDQVSIWMCSTCYQRFGNEEEAENCTCIDLN